MIDRVSSKMSLIAAQISSFVTRTLRPYDWTIGKVSRPTSRDGDAVGEDADAIERDPRRGDRLIHRVRLERLDADHATPGRRALT